MRRHTQHTALRQRYRLHTTSAKMVIALQLRYRIGEHRVKSLRIGLAEDESRQPSELVWVCRPFSVFTLNTTIRETVRSGRPVTTRAGRLE